MADGTTTNYSFTQPEVGASEDTWGTKLNANWASLDALLSGTGTVSGLIQTGGTIDDTVIGGTTPKAGSFTTLSCTTRAKFGGTTTTVSDAQTASASTAFFASAPWLYASALEAVTEGSASSTGIAIGSGGSSNTTQTAANEIMIWSQGADVVKITSASGLEMQGGKPITGNLTGDVTGNVTGTAGALNNVNLGSAGIANVTGKASTSEAQDGTDNDQLMSALRVKEAYDYHADARRFTSAAQTITSGGLITVAHGLASTPVFISFRLVCTTSDAGYNPGDEIIVDQNGSNASNNRYSTPRIDATNVRVRFSSDANAFAAGIKSTGVVSGLTNGSWDLYIEAMY